MANNFENFLKEIKQLGIEPLAEEALKNALNSYKAKQAQEEENKKNILYLVRFDNRGKVRIRQVIRYHGSDTSLRNYRECYVTDLKGNNQTYAFKNELRKTKTGALRLAVKLYQKDIKDWQARIQYANKKIPELEALLDKAQQQLYQNTK